MRVCGIDPGLTRCGIGIVEVSRDRRARLVWVDVVRTEPTTSLEQRVLAISLAVAEALDRFSPDVVALERVFAQLNVRTVMGTAQASGVVLAAAAARGLSVALHTPTEVKAAITGYGRADKPQVGAMVARILGLDEVPKPADAADALALAICHGWRGTTAHASAPLRTPAQRAWAEAEKQSRHRASTPQASS